MSVADISAPSAPDQVQPAAAPGVSPVPFQMRLVNGRPTILCAGQPLEMPAFCEGITRSEADWRARLEPFIRNGVKIYHLTTGNWGGVYGQTEFWTDDGVYPEVSPGLPGFTLESRVDYILSRVPNALFILRLPSIAPKAWIAKNPDQMELDSDGHTYQPSWASEKYLNGVSTHFARIVGYCESRPWSGHIMGYLVVPDGEGLQIHAGAGYFFDRSPAMQAAWTAWLTHKYGTDDALRRAWNDQSASLAAPVPTDAEWRAKIAVLPHWPAPGSLAPEHDYVDLQRELFARWFNTLTRAVADNVKRPVLIGIDALKQPLLGWQPEEEFSGSGDGTASISPLLASGSIGIGKFLDSPWITNLMTPADYHARTLGFGFEAEGLNDSLVLRGKGLLIENDARTYLSQETPDRTPPLGSWMNPAEIRAGLLRNTASSLSRGAMPYWMDIGYRAGFYTDPALQGELKADQTLQAQASHWPLRETQNAIAVIIDDESPLYENFTTGFQNLAILRQRIEGLELCGIPYRVYLLSDLEKDNFPDYRCYLFPNLFKVDDQVIDLLKRKVLRDGNLAIFGPGTGITDGTAVSSAGAEKLLGIPMRLYDATAARRIRIGDRALLPLQATNMPSVYGDGYGYGPILVPDVKRLTPDVQVLGAAVITWNINGPGLVLKNFGQGGTGDGTPGPRGAGDYAVAFSAAIPLPPALLRSLARYGGCNVWCDDDVALFANHDMVALHSVDSKTVTINLPWKPKTVTDAVTGQTVAKGVRSFQVKMTAPETKLFLLK